MLNLLKTWTTAVSKQSIGTSSEHGCRRSQPLQGHAVVHGVRGRLYSNGRRHARRWRNVVTAVQRDHGRPHAAVALSAQGRFVGSNQDDVKKIQVIGFVVVGY